MAAALVFVGDRSALFEAMAGAGPIAAGTLADTTGIHPRYVEQWLGAMTCIGYVEHDGASDTFVLPDEHALFFVDPASEYYFGGMFTALPAMIGVAPRLAAAFTRGDGISFEEFGAGLPLALERRLHEDPH